MAFSKGKRIEDETSKRIVDLAVNIGCKEGMSALTVTLQRGADTKGTRTGAAGCSLL